MHTRIQLNMENHTPLDKWTLPYTHQGCRSVVPVCKWNIVITSFYRTTWECLTNLNSRYIGIKEFLVSRPFEENIFGFNSEEVEELSPWSPKVNRTFANKSNLKRWWSYIWGQLIPPKEASAYFDQFCWLKLCFGSLFQGILYDVSVPHIKNNSVLDINECC